MPAITVDGTALYYEEIGAGSPVILIHGGMVQGSTWEFVAPQLAQRFRVITYDRRGYGRTGGEPSGIAASHADDLAALVVALDAAPAHVVANSSGGVVALHLAIEHPDLVDRMALHEPALVGLLAGDRATQPQLDRFMALVDAVAALVEGGDHEAAARRFVESIVAPGAWQVMPAARREMMARNARNVLADRAEKDRSFTMAPELLARVSAPVLLSGGAHSPEVFGAVVERIAALLPDVQLHTFTGAGHVPHVTHPAEFVEVVASFLEDPPRAAR